MAVLFASRSTSTDSYGFPVKIIGGRNKVAVDMTIKTDDLVAERLGYEPLLDDIDRWCSEVSDYNAHLATHHHKDHIMMLAEAAQRHTGLRAFMSEGKLRRPGGGLYGFVMNGSVNWLEVKPPKKRRPSIPPIETFKMHGRDKVVKIRAPHYDYQGMPMDNVYMNSYLIRVDDVKALVTGDIMGQMNTRYLQTIEPLKPDVVFMDGVNFQVNMNYGLDDRALAQYGAIEKSMKGLKTMMTWRNPPQKIVIDHHSFKRRADNGDPLRPVRDLAKQLNFKGEVKCVNDLPQLSGTQFRGFKLT